MSNTILIPPGGAQPRLSASAAHVIGGVTVDGVSLSLNFTSDALTHVIVSSSGDGGTTRGHSWLGWARTAEPVTQADVNETGARLARELLASMNSEVLCVAAIEEVRRRFFEHQKDQSDAGWGAAGAMSGILPLVCVLVNRIGPEFAEKAHALQTARNAAEPPMTYAEGVAATLEAIQEGLGDRGEVRVLLMPSDLGARDNGDPARQSPGSTPS